MKTDIHPKYYENAKARCACGNKWTTSSTISEIHTGICAKCHPFYTGQEKILDTMGRVERFKKRLERSATKGKRAK
jgi:large subunit ribosomal protein L31